MLTFCSHQEELTWIAGDREGLSGTEIVGVIGKDLEIIDWFVALSRRCLMWGGLVTENGLSSLRDFCGIGL